MSELRPLNELKRGELGAVRPYFRHEDFSPEVLESIRGCVDYALYFGSHSNSKEDIESAVAFVEGFNPATTILCIEGYDYPLKMWELEFKRYQRSPDRPAFQEVRRIAIESGMDVYLADSDAWDGAHWRRYQRLVGADKVASTLEVYPYFHSAWQYPYEDAAAIFRALWSKSKLRGTQMDGKAYEQYNLGAAINSRCEAAMRDLLMVGARIARDIHEGKRPPVRHAIASPQGAGHIEILTEKFRNWDMPYTVKRQQSASPTLFNPSDFFIAFVGWHSDRDTRDPRIFDLRAEDKRNIYEIYRREFGRLLPPDWHSMSRVDKIRTNVTLMVKLTPYFNELASYFITANSVENP